MKNYLFALLLLLAITSCKDKKEPLPIDEPVAVQLLHTYLDSVNKTAILPGFGVMIFDRDSVLYAQGYGYADKADKKPFSPQSVQLVASVSKIFVGTSLMISMRNTELHPDISANNFLPFALQNQAFPQVPITLRHLATHTSGINDTDNYKRSYLFPYRLDSTKWPEAWLELIPYYQNNKAISLESFLNELVAPGKSLYQEDIYSEYAPGTNYNYSNVGTSLLALCIEKATKTSFSDWSTEQIFNPLGMEQTSWFPEDFKAEDHVKYYLENGHPLEPYTLITYPDGGLYTSMKDLSLFGQDLLKSGQGEGRILSRSEFELMIEPSSDPEKFPDGICWDLSVAPLIGHGGNDFGTSTLFYLNPDSGIGYILFANSSIETTEQEDTFYGIYNELFQYDW